jgi:uncharacterized protein YndB with AHSA1/START domain
MSEAPVVIRKEAFYPHEPQRVWAAITDGQALAHWLMPNTFKPVLGHEFRFQFDPMPMLPGNVVDCKVLELDPPRRMVWSWSTPVAPGKRRWPDQQIEWTLTPKGNGTLLILEQRRIGSEPPPGFIFKLMMSHGWKTMLNRWLPKVIDATEPTPTGYAYRKLSKAPNRGHHGTKTLPPEFFK